MYPTVKCLYYHDITIHIRVVGQATRAASQVSLRKVTMGTISIIVCHIIKNVKQIANVPLNCTY